MDGQYQTIQFHVESVANHRTNRVRSRVNQEDVHIRSYDHQWAYDLEIEIMDSSGQIIYENWYYLQPGQTENEFDVFSRGDCKIRVTMDSSKREVMEFETDRDRDTRIVIEVGNGVLSLSERTR